MFKAKITIKNFLKTIKYWIKHIQTITIIKIIAIVMLFLALDDNPYGYYQILRWVITGVAGYSAYLAYEKGKNTWAWIMAITAILYNPIAPIYLDRETWAVLNVITAAVILISMFKMEVVAKILKTIKK